jgi:hypothetical protein
MTWSLTSPVTGAPETSFTSPTYTHVADQAPDTNSKQVAVTALGGTQTGVVVHSVAAPFTGTAFRPKTFKVLGKTNPVTGELRSVPMNVYKVISRKGVIVLAGQPYSIARMTTLVEVPAGCDVADPANLKALQSFHIGSLWQQSTGLGDTTIAGVL